MKYITSIHAYDCLSSVVYACHVREYQDYEQGPSVLVLDLSGSLVGEGIDNPREWLKDVLVALLETL